jgi:hypothetical protein
MTDDQTATSDVAAWLKFAAILVVWAALVFGVTYVVTGAMTRAMIPPPPIPTHPSLVQPESPEGR